MQRDSKSRRRTARELIDAIEAEKKSKELADKLKADELRRARTNSKRDQIEQDRLLAKELAKSGQQVSDDTELAKELAAEFDHEYAASLEKASETTTTTTTTSQAMKAEVFQSTDASKLGVFAPKYQSELDKSLQNAPVGELSGGRFHELTPMLEVTMPLSSNQLAQNGLAKFVSDKKKLGGWHDLRDGYARTKFYSCILMAASENSFCTDVILLALFSLNANGGENVKRAMYTELGYATIEKAAQGVAAKLSRDNPQLKQKDVTQRFNGFLYCWSNYFEDFGYYDFNNTPSTLINEINAFEATIQGFKAGEEALSEVKQWGAFSTSKLTKRLAEYGLTNFIRKRNFLERNFAIGDARVNVYERYLAAFTSDFFIDLFFLALFSVDTGGGANAKRAMYMSLGYKTMAEARDDVIQKLHTESPEIFKEPLKAKLKEVLNNLHQAIERCVECCKKREIYNYEIASEAVKLEEFRLTLLAVPEEVVTTYQRKP